MANEIVSKNLKNKVKALPRSPGVYLFLNEQRKVIYVGKSKSLHDRVSSYFVKEIDLGPKTRALVENIRDLNFIEVGSELESLLLEAELIKRYKPKYNIILKDDKSYKYIYIENFELDGENLPVVGTTREAHLKKAKGAYYFGPFPEGRTVFEVLRAVRKLVPFRDCSTGKFRRYKNMGRPCLYGYVGLCSAPCVGKISPENYRKQIRTLRNFLTGKSKTVIEGFESKMKKASKDNNFEEAAYYRDLIKKFEYVSQHFKAADSYITNPNLIQDTRDQSLKELTYIIPSLLTPPERIECYDISNISGKAATASMVVSVGGKIQKSEYRKFRIKTKDTPDDYHMMQEVLKRRFRSKNIGDWGMPDLVVVDGGQGQVSIAQQVFQELGIKLTVVGLAKRQETIVIPSVDGFTEVNPDFSNEGLKHLMALRDEAHRFSRVYHHQLRSRELLNS